MMKKILFAMMFTSVLTSYAQPLFYNFNDTTIAYSNLVGSTVTSAWTNEVAIAFKFKFFGRSVDSVRIQPNYIYFTQNEDDNITLGQENYVAENNNPSLSPISYLISGTTPNRIMKIEYKNIRVNTGDMATEYIENNQIWLYESDNSIEFRFGTNSVTDLNFNTFFYTLLDFDNSPYLGVSGTLAAPTFMRILNSGTFKGLPEHPTANTVYRFSPNENSSSVADINTLKPYQISYNENGVNIKSTEKLNAELFDLSGKLIYTFTIDNNSSKIETNNLPKGVYLIKLNNDKVDFMDKISIF